MNKEEKANEDVHCSVWTSYGHGACRTLQVIDYTPGSMKCVIEKTLFAATFKTLIIARVCQEDQIEKASGFF